MADQEDFQAPDGFDTNAIAQFRDEALQVAALIADQLQDAGFSTRQGASMAAHILLDAAWAIAACGAFAEGVDPRPEKFIEAAQRAIDRMDIDATKAKFADLAEADAVSHG